MEMTGLEPAECTILEMASVVTTSDLVVVAQGPHLVIHHDDIVLAGNSVDLDHRFIQQHMPGLATFLQDRVIDVTALKELARRWFPQQKPPPKKDTHRALEDILESIEELRFYKTNMFKRPA